MCVFLPVVFILTLAIPSMRAKNVLLAVASLAFYAYGEPVYVLLMIASTMVNWGLGCLLGKLEGEEGSRKLVLALAVVANLAALGFFKYSPLLVNSTNDLLGTTIQAPDVALPIGISFYTFQAMSYVIDVYRGNVTPQYNFLKVMLYISFFPQLIAGPIIKYHDVDEQLTSRKITLSGTAEGFRRFCIGLAKKVLIANCMAVTADTVFNAEPSEINVAVAWIGALAYLIQIYFDFSGYSDMAIGLAKMFGFTYKENFQYPYISTSIKEFWRRWHISLSTWLKEYLYIPLGGNRKGKLRTVINKVVVFFLCGLWHGAAWTFAVWGLIHGFFLLLEEYFPRLGKLPKPVGWVYCMLVVTFAFVLFRADSFDQGLMMMGQMVAGFHFEYACTSLALQQLTPVFILTFVVSIVAATPIKSLLQRWAERSEHSLVLVTASYLFAFLLLGLCMMTLASGGYNPFIYFRF